jgi:Helix-hairpin-helix motif
MISKQLIFALCCSAGVALPLAVTAQLPKTPAVPGGATTPSVPGEMKPSMPGGMPGTKAQDLTAPGTGGGSTPAPTETPTPTPTGTTAPSPTPTPEPTASPASTTPKKSGKSTTVKVNVNTSTLQQLTKVKGIGTATAKKIVANRPYATMEDLVTKKALTQKQLIELKPQLEL